MTRPAYPDFAPRTPWRGPDLQTLRNLLRGPALPAPNAHCARLTLALGDGSGDRLLARLYTPETLRDGAPLVVLIHGLGGSEETSLTANLLQNLLNAGCFLRGQAGAADRLLDVPHGGAQHGRPVGEATA